MKSPKPPSPSSRATATKKTTEAIFAMTSPPARSTALRATTPDELVVCGGSVLDVKVVI